MKKIIFLMLVYVFAYLGAMSFVEQHYNYSWIHKKAAKENTPPVEKTPAPQEKQFPTEQMPPLEQKTLVVEEHTSEIFPQESGEIQNIEQTSAQEFKEMQKTEQIPSQEPQAPIEIQQQLPQETTENQAVTEVLPTQNIQEEAPKEEPKTEKPLTLAEQLKEKDLIDIETLNKKLFLKMPYATKNNFTGKKLYKRAKCYLKRSAAKALAKAADYALQADEPFYLCIYDCYRPNSVQKIMLKSTEIKGYLSKVSNHSRGMAVDLGPCDEQGEPLLTPTEFDTFSELSGAYNYDDQIPQIAIENRTNLQEIMKKAGFSTISNEWWHFDYKGAKNAEVLDIKF